MFADTASDVHPPLYYIFTTLGYRLIGNYGWVYHLVSLIPYAIVLLVSVSFVRKKYGTIAAFITVTCSSLMSWAIMFNVEVRMYSWAALFLFLSYLSFHRILEDHNKKDYIFFMLFSLTTAYTHYYALVSVAFFYVVLIFEAIIKKKYVLKTLVTCISTVIFYLPWLFVLIGSFIIG